jgi:hypothetical protein
VQLGGGGQPRRGVAGGEARKRRLAGLAVDAVVVVALDPGGEQPVALGEVACAAAGVQLDQELLTDGAEEPFDLAAPLRLTRPGVDRRTPRTAQARSSWWEQNAEPLST